MSLDNRGLGTSDATPSSLATHGSANKQILTKSLYSVPSNCIVHSMSVETNRIPSMMLPTTSKSPEFITKVTHPPIQQTSKTIHALHPHRNVSIHSPSSSLLERAGVWIVHGESERVLRDTKSRSIIWQSRPLVHCAAISTMQIKVGRGLLSECLDLPRLF